MTELQHNQRTSQSTAYAFDARLKPLLKLATEVCHSTASLLMPLESTRLNRAVGHGLAIDTFPTSHPIIKKTSTQPNKVHTSRQIVAGNSAVQRCASVGLLGENDQVWAILIVYDETKRPFTVQHKQHLNSIAQAINAHFLIQPTPDQTAELHIQTDRLLNVLQHLPIGMLVEDEHRRIVVANAPFCRLFQIPVAPELLIGSDCSQSAEQAKHLCREPEEFVQTIERFLRERKPVQNWEFSLANGSIYACTYFPIVLDNQHRGNLWCYRDVTLERQQAQQLNQRNQHFLALYETTLNLVRQAQLEPDSLLQNLIQKACDLFAASDGYLTLWNEQLQAYAVRVYVGTAHPNVVNQPRSTTDGMLGHVLRTQQPLIVNDYQNWEDRHPEFVFLHSLMAVPLFAHNQIIGALFVASSKERTFTIDDCDLLMLYAQLAVVVLENTRLYSSMIHEIQERQKAEQTLKEQQSILQDLFDNASDMIFVATMQGKFVFANKAWERTLGYTLADLQDRITLDLVHPDYRAQALHNMVRLQQEIDHLTCDTVFVARDGKLIYVEGNFNVQREQGQPVAIRSIVRDITERRALETAVQERNRNHTAMVKALNDGVLLLDSQGNVIEWNDSAEHILALSHGWLQAKNAYYVPTKFIYPNGSLVAQADLPAFKTLNTGQPIENTVLGILRDDAPPTWISINTSPLIREHEKQPYGVVLSFHDITKQREIEQALRDAKEEAEAANIAKSAFLANMSHEFRTPLTAIIGYSEIVKEDIVDQQARNDLQHILDAGKHLLALVNDLLDIAKIESGQEKLTFEWVAVEQIVVSAGEIVAPLLEQQRNTLLIASIDPSLTIYADQRRLHQIVLNLLSNAAKFTQNGTITLNVQPIVVDDQPWIDVQVQDTGIGMSSTQLRDLFKEFSQVHEQKRSQHKGTGLGLVISRKLSERMGGTIFVESSEGVGSTFTLRLPDQRELT